jgi:hypothetical protein
MKMHRQGKITIQQAKNMFEKYGIAVICEGDFREYHVEVDHIIKYVTKK